MIDHTIIKMAKIHNNGNKNPMNINKIPLIMPKWAFIVDFINNLQNNKKSKFLYKYCD